VIPLDPNAPQPVRFVAIDTETTGSSRLDRVIEFAAVFFQDGVEVGRLVRRINPCGHPISPMATRVHGIRARDLVGKPSFAQLAGTITRCLEGKVVVAHNLAYDKRMLRQEFERLGLQWPTTLAEVCTLKRCKRELHSLSDHRLPTVCRALDITLERHHAADADARACGLLMVALEERGEVAA